MWNFKEMLRTYPNLDIGDRKGSTDYNRFYKNHGTNTSCDDRKRPFW